MEIEILEKKHIRVKDEVGTSFDLYTFKEGGIQILSAESHPLKLENRLPASVIIDEK